MTTVLDPESGEHWVALREYEAKWGFRPEHLVGEDGYHLVVGDGCPRIRLTEAGKAKLTEIVTARGPAALAVLDRVLADHRAEFGC